MAVVLLAARTTFAAEQIWVGQISDSICGAKHESESIGEGNGKISDPDVAKHAGQSVKVTGEIKGESITVSKIEIP